jgi:hypothetical protein
LFGASCLDPDALVAAGRRFRAHPARLLVVDDALDDGVALALHRFLDREAVFTASHGLYSANGAVSERRWHEAAPEDRMFRFRVMTGNPGDETEGATAFTQLERLLLGAAGGELFEALSDQPLGDGTPVTAYAYGPDDFLGRHSDRGGGRRLAFIFYLGRWQPGEGGELRLWLDGGDSIDVTPRFNRLVLFDLAVHRHHEVLAVSGPRQRYTIGGWRRQPRER